MHPSSPSNDEHEHDHVHFHHVQTVDIIADDQLPWLLHTPLNEIDRASEVTQSQSNETLYHSHIMSCSDLSSSTTERCRICHESAEENPLIRPCKCAGTMAFVHAHCLAQWAAASGKKDKCDTCMTFYATSGKHYKPLVEWKAPLRNGAAYVLVFTRLLIVSVFAYNVRSMWTLLTERCVFKRAADPLAGRMRPDDALLVLCAAGMTTLLVLGVVYEMFKDAQFWQIYVNKHKVVTYADRSVFARLSFFGNDYDEVLVV